MNAEEIRIESTEYGFELHIETDTMGPISMNIQGVAWEFYADIINKIGPWVAEGKAAERECRSGRADDPSQQAALDRVKANYDEDDDPWPGESALDFYKRTGNDDPLRDQADTLNKARKET